MKTSSKRSPGTHTEQPSYFANVLDTVQTGDCVEGMKQLPDKCVDMCFSDPPFNLGREYDVYEDNRTRTAYLEWCCDWLDECSRLLKPTGSLFVCASDEVVCELKILAENVLELHDAASGEIRRSGSRLFARHHVIWTYTFGVNSPKKLTRSHTHILHFVKSLTKHQWHENEVRVPSARQLHYNDKRANPKGRLPDDTWFLRPQEILDDQSDTQYHSRVAGTFKERMPIDNMMPEQLIARFVRWTTSPGDLVLSPFLGSGTDAAVAKKLGRRYIGYEISETYSKAARARLAAARPGDMLDPPKLTKSRRKPS